MTAVWSAMYLNKAMLVSGTPELVPPAAWSAAWPEAAGEEDVPPRSSMTGGLAHQLLGRALGMHPRLGQVLGLFLGPFLARLGTTDRGLELAPLISPAPRGHLLHDLLLDVAPHLGTKPSTLGPLYPTQYT